jgi:Ca2+-binding RTX toxin-like protein
LIGGSGDDVLWGDAYTGGYIIPAPDGGVLRFVYLTGVLHPGNDVLEGGDGNDYLSGDSGDDALDGGAGDDFLVGDAEAYVNVTLRYPTTPGDDFLSGGGGNDTLNGNAGNDVLLGGEGNDILWGDDQGVDASQEGNDWLEGGAGADQLFGLGRNDTLIGGAGADVLFGGDGNDSLDGGEGDDTGFGGAGDDRIQGGSGADQFDGEAGNDVMSGDDGNDLLIGGDGLDQLDGGAGDDQLSGGADADTIFGGEGNDELQGGLGNDVLTGDTGDDRIFGQEGDDQIFGGDGNDGLRGDDGNDELEGGAGDDILVGDADGQIGGTGGNDTLAGGAGNDTLVGGGGQDIYLFDPGDGFDIVADATGEANRLVFGGGISPASIAVAAGPSDSLVVRVGNSGDAIQILNFGTANVTGSHPIDTFEFSDGTILTYNQLVARGLGISGGAGNDVVLGSIQSDQMYGGAGNDTLQGLDGADRLLGEDGADRLEGGVDNDILVGGQGDDTLLGGTGNDRLLGGVGADILQGDAGLDALEGGAGDDSLDGGEGDDVLSGGAGNDTLQGGAGADVLTGNQGNDQLDGGDGNDTYRYSFGDGADLISDSGPTSDTDTAVFGTGISSSDLRLKVDSGLAFPTIGAGTDGLYVGSTSNVLESGSVEQFQFSDGTSLSYAELIARGFDIDGTEGDDFLIGTDVVDRFRGGLGNDRLEGDGGNDAYFFNVGDGIDTIVDTAVPGAGNEVVFGAGITPGDLQLDLTPDQSDPNLSDVLIHVGVNGDAVQLTPFDRNNVFGPRAAETFRFADGSTLTYEQLLARGFDIVGTDGDDRMEGTNITDRISGGAGADVLRGGLGDDQLDGGAGDDRLFGGQGNDTYLFGPGSERDTIVEFQGSQDRIRMAPEVSPSDVMATRNNNDLVLSLNGSADRLTVSLYFLAPPLEIEEVEFVDGTVWDQAVIENLMRPAITGTGGNDTLVGTSGNDRLLGLGGDDELTGLAGNDVLDGGTGADTMIGGTGSDDYRLDDAGDVVTELPNEGTDTVESSISYTLGANVENLALTGAAAINGTGNSLDNVLIGNRAANVLTGGLGNDLYEVGAGDTVIELPGEGTDTVMSKVSASLGANLENLTILGGRSLTGTGNELDNVMSAPGSISILAGGFGNDTYLVGPGDDRDTIVEMPGEGIDTVRASQSYRLPDNVERLELVDPLLIPVPGADPLQGLLLSGMNVTDSYGNPLGPNGTGNALANTLMGTNRNNVLDGGAGADTLVGGAGDDRYVVDNVDDLVIEEANEGTDSVLSTAVSYQLPAYVEDLTLSGTAPISGTGNALDNTIVGNEAANVLDGGAGNDWLQGFGGADTYRFSRGSGQDTVFDFSVVGEVDTVQMASGVASADVSVYQRPGDLVLVINGTTDELTLSSFFGPTEYAQKQVLFADGTVWNEAELRTRAVAVGGTTAGTTGNDQLTGGVGHDVLIGDADDDVLTGGLGNDVLFGDAQTNNPYFPVVGNDSLFGGPGDDILRDFQGANVFDGGAGDDSLFLGEGQDTILFGRGAGSDLVYFDNAESDLDLIQLAADLSPSDVELTRDSQLSNSLTLRIRDTGDQMSLILSTSYPNVLPEDVQGRIQFANGTAWDLTWTPVGDPTIGTLGNDVLDAAFPSSLQGLGGNDEYRFGSPGIAGEFSAIEAVDGGTDTVQSYFDYTLDPNVENLILVESGSSVIPNPLSGTGNELNNIIIGNTGDNILDGRSGDDVLVGGLFLVEQDNHLVGDNGSDVLIGGQGDDTLIPFVPDVCGFGYLNLNGNSFSSRGYDLEFPNTPDDLLIGGQGNDIYILFNSGETVFELEDEGVDTVRSTVDYTLGANVENLTLLEKYATTPWAIQGVGNELDNLLVGNVSGNVLRGEGGDDTLWGGPSTSLTSFNPGEEAVNPGNDILIGGAGDDTYLFNLGDGIDTIADVASPGEGNRIEFGTGISRNDLSITRDEVARTLAIQVGSGGTDKLVLTNFDPTGANGSLVVETLAFADGSDVSLASLLGPTITLFGTENDDVLVGTADSDGIDAGAGNDTVYANGGDDLVLAGEGDDVVTGEDGADTIFGGGGTDYLYGGDGNDVINGEDGNDSLAGNAGNDTLNGGLGNDVLGGGDGDDVLNGEAGNDSFYGGGGNDLINAGDGDDAVAGEAGNDIILGGSGGDYLYGGDGDDVLDGQDGNDVVVGEAGVDIVNGGAGNDVLNGGAGADQLYGGEGDDVLYIDGADTVVNGGAGYDSVTVLTLDAVTLDATAGQVEFVQANSGNDVLTAVGSVTGRTLYGGDGNDQITGGDGNDGLAGQGGNDTVFGGLGNDVLSGGDGDDLLDGGSGNDAIYTGTGNDLVNAGEGDDAVSGEEGADTIFGGSGTDYLYGGDGNDMINGDDGNDTLVGDMGEDTLNGGAGNDVLNGGMGADQLFGGDGDDTIYMDATDTVVSGGAGYDSVTVLGPDAVTLNAATAEVEFVAGSSGNDVVTAVGSLTNVTLYGGEGDDRLTGGDGNDGLVGQAGNDTLFGGLGNDGLNGGEGDDVLDGGAGNDAFYAGSGNDQLNGGDGDDAMNGEEGADTIFAGSGQDYLYGGAGDDLLYGEEGHDVLSGDTGNDTLAGGLGNDYLAGGTGNDQYLFARGDGADTISEDDAAAGNSDRLLFGADINPLDMVISRQADSLRLAVYGTSEQVTIENWYLGEARQVETLQAGNGEVLLNTQVDQLIQAMAGFSQQTGLTWEQGIEQRPQEVQAVLAASWR